MRETTIGKFQLIEMQNPDGTGYTVYAKSGPEGMSQVINTGDISLEIMNKVLGWLQEERPPIDPRKPIDPKPHFDATNWRF